MTPMKFEFGDKELTLVLNGQATVDIEKQLGKSLFGIMMAPGGKMTMPRLGEMLVILHAANMTANIKMKDMPALYDSYVAAGGSMMKLFEVIQKLMERAGFFESEETGDADLTGEVNPEDDEDPTGSLV